MQDVQGAAGQNGEEFKLFVYPKRMGVDPPKMALNNFKLRKFKFDKTDRLSNKSWM